MLFWWITAVPPLACEQALRSALAAGREKEVELTTASLKFEFHLQFHCGSPSTELSDFCQSAFASTFSMQIFKFQRRTCKLSFLFPPRRQSTLKSLLAGYIDINNKTAKRKTTWVFPTFQTDKPSFFSWFNEQSELRCNSNSIDD